MPETIVQIIGQLAKDLQEPIAEYYDAINDDSPLATLRQASARMRIPDKFQKALSEAIDRGVQYITGTPVVPASVRDMVNDFKREQAAYARGFMDELAGLTERGALARAASYATAIMHLTTQVATDDIPPLPIYPGDERLECGPFCYCHLEIVHLGGGDYNVFWRLGQAEHCQDCPELAIAWNPLPIRNGKIVTGDIAMPAAAKMHEKSALAVVRAYVRGAA